MSIVSPTKTNFSLQNPHLALADTATPHNYLDEKSIPYCNTTVPAFGSQVKVANGNIITPIAQTEMYLVNELSTHAQHAYIFNDLATGSLILIGHL